MNKYIYNKKTILFYIISITLSLNIQAKVSTTKPEKQKLLLSKEKDDYTNKNKQEKNMQKDIYSGLEKVAEVVSQIEKNSYTTVDFAAFFDAALKYAVPAALDPHSAFFTPDVYLSTKESTSGQFSGIGVSIISKNLQDPDLLIVDVIPDGPAFKAGIKREDKIFEVDGVKLQGKSTDEIINLLKGKIGTKVKIKLLRDKKTLDFEIVREIIKDQTSICFHFVEQNIYYLSLKLFTETAAKQMSSLLEKANKGKCNGIVLDLRRNPGGILDSAVEMASLFLPKKSLIVITKNKKNKVVAEYFTQSDPILKSDVPIFILIDNFTASASEILAGCLKYYSEKSFNTKEKNTKKMMVFLLGTPTFGKGSVQEVIPLKTDGCALKLTTMLYYLPNNQTIQALGIEPDFLVNPKIIPVDELKLFNELVGKESTLKNYITPPESQKSIIEAKKSKTESEEDKKNWDEKQREAIMLDPQIQSAINMICLINNTINISNSSSNTSKQFNTRQEIIDFVHKNYLTDKTEKIKLVKVD